MVQKSVAFYNFLLIVREVNNCKQRVQFLLEC